MFDGCSFFVRKDCYLCYFCLQNILPVLLAVALSMSDVVKSHIFSLVASIPTKFQGETFVYIVCHNTFCLSYFSSLCSPSISLFLLFARYYLE